MLTAFVLLGACGRSYENKQIGCGLGVAGGFDCDNGTATLSICAPIGTDLDASNSSATTRESDGTFITTFSAQSGASNCINFQTAGGSNDIPVPEETGEVFICVRKTVQPSTQSKPHYATVTIS